MCFVLDVVVSRLHRADFAVGDQVIVRNQKLARQDLVVHDERPVQLVLVLVNERRRQFLKFTDGGPANFIAVLNDLFFGQSILDTTQLHPIVPVAHCY